MEGWRRTDEFPGTSVARLARTPSGWTASGVETIIGARPSACWFRVDLDADWLTRAAEIRVLDPDGERTTTLAADDDRRWRIDGADAPHLDGCVDIDVAATPLTNTFPIRRYADLAVGQTRTVPVAWVEVPSLAVLRVEQTYERLGDRRWRYLQAEFGAFVIDVDPRGVVTTYEGFAERA